MQGFFVHNSHLDIYYLSHFLRGSRYSINENDNNNSKDNNNNSKDNNNNSKDNNNNNSNNKKHDNKYFRLLIVRTQQKWSLYKDTKVAIP